MQQAFLKPTVLGLLILFCSSVSGATDFSACDAQYAQRGSSLQLSVSCYKDAFKLSSSKEEKKALYERIFISLFTTISDMPKTDQESNAISDGMSVIANLSTDFPNSAEFYYWHACMLSAQSTKEDRGSIIPKHMLANLKIIQSELNQAYTIDPTVHGYGPSRVIGLMNTALPSMVGGNKKLAEQKLGEAYTHVPSMPVNHISYAKILKINGKTTEAKIVLNHFLAMKDVELNPYPAEPLRALTEETVKARADALNLLQDLN